MMSRSVSGRLLSLVLSTALTGLIATIPARADDCSNEKALKSLPSSASSEIDFQNRSNEKRRIYWVDQDGDRKFYGIVEPGNIFKQPTLLNHAWVVTDDAEKCLYTFVATAEPRVVEVGESAAVAPPPPGGQQPIAQPQPAAQPPVVAQVPPPPPVVQASPAASDSSAPVTAPDEPLPQVSPVEQFQLRGAYRLASRLDPSRVLNNDAAGTLFVVAVKPEWDSAQWTFEAVAGTPFVRIRNIWKGTYLADFNGKPRAMPAAPAAPETHWTFEPIDGTEFVQFRNRETDRFLLAINGAAALVDAFGPEQEAFSQWRTTPAGAPIATAPPPQRPLYDAAAASCRQIGGYWTGSSCRRPVYMTERLACPRGFVWAEEVGECIWDEGACPPWQQGPGGICGPNLTCRGGAVAPGPRGNPACYCPAGQVAWGNYPNLSCVPSIARVAPLLIPAVVAGTAIAIIGSNQGRPSIGQVYGNNKFCGPGQTGTPPNCVTAQTCQPPLVGTPPNCTRLVGPIRVNACPAGQIRGSNDACVTITCAGGTVNQSTCTCPAGTTRQGGGANFQCVAAATPPTPPVGGGGGTTQNPVITCAGGTLNQGACTCPAGTSRQGGGTNFQCVAVATPPTPPVGGGGGTTPTPICNLGERLVDGKCVNLNAAITCTGGRVEQGVCACPQGTRLTGSGNNFQCVAAQVTTPTTQRACTAGENPQSANCQCKDPLQVFDGKCQAFTTISPTTPTGGQRACTAGEVPQSANCQCRNPLQVFDGKCQAFTTISPTTPPGGQRACNAGEVPQSANCQCRSPLLVADGKCQAATTTPQTNPNQPVGGPPLCTDGQNTASGCRCAAPLTVLPGGKCAQPTKPGAQCLEGQNIAATGCVCGPPLKPIENGFCGRLLLNETKPLAKGGTCAEGADIKATGCQCNMNTVDAGGGKFICSANARPAGGGTTTSPTGGPPLCTDGQNTASGCRCAAPLTVLPGGKCAQPTKAGAQCLEGQNIAATGCVCGPPLKPIENGFCGRLLLNETKPLAKGGACGEGADIKATGCQCNMKTVDAGGGKFICSANAAPPSGGRLAPVQPAPCPAGTTGTPPNCKANPPPTCPAGTTGTPPNCKANPPPTCPAGTTGTPPNCKANPPPTCPAGTTGTPPNCKANPPPTCPAGTTGSPPNCKANPPPTCPAGTTGSPPNCKANPPPTCPAGTTGSPPNCRANPPPTCPAGMTGSPPNCRPNAPPPCPAGTTGIPPNCRPAQTQPQPQPQQLKPTGGPPSCAPPKRLLPNGQCV